ncbi:MAG: hypothetical protein ACPG61_10250 [Paracoccaceae bacterium]
MNITFPTEAAAETALRAAGFSIGRTQRTDPRGLMHGNWDIQKWRNLSCKERKQCHGIHKRQGPPGSPVLVQMNDHCPLDAKSRLLALAQADTQQPEPEHRSAAEIMRGQIYNV